ncbi:MAG: hypothetical protein ACM3VW_08395 [Bacteroidota bacterium]
MRIIWYKPHQAPELYQPRYYPVAFSRADESIYLPELDPVQLVEEAVDQLFQDDLISAEEFGEVLRALYERQGPGERLHETTLYKTPVQLEQFEQAPGLRPFRVEVLSDSCSVLVREVRWLRVPPRGEDDEEQQRLGVWLWVAGCTDADLVDFDLEETYLADDHGEELARLTEFPQGYRRGNLDELVALPQEAPLPLSFHFATTLVLDVPAEREPAPPAASDVLRVALRMLKVQREVAGWDFTATAPVYPLIKQVGDAVLLVEGVREGALDAGAERRYLDDRNALGEQIAEPYYPEHPVFLVAARLPMEMNQTPGPLDNWRTPVDLLQQCPLTVRLQAHDGSEIVPTSVSIRVQSDQPDEWEACYHFCNLREFPPLRGLEVEVQKLTEA